MQAIREFNQHYPQVLGHSEEHLAQGLCLLFLLTSILEPRKLRYAVHQFGHAGPKLLCNLRQATLRIFRYVMQDCCSERLHIHVDVGKDKRYLKWVTDVLVPRLS